MNQQIQKNFTKRPLPPKREQANYPSDALRIASLGGFNDVTQNLFVYEFIPQGREKDSQILIVDCGVGFPESDFLGVDLVIPDTRYLEERKDRILGILITHGHEDHVGALSYVLPKIGKDLPVYAPRLAAALAENRLSEAGQKVRFRIVEEDKPIDIGPFHIEPIHVTHSIRDTFHYLISTPIGNFYHGSDYKFDLKPINEAPPNLRRIAQLSQKGITCLLSDCLGSDHEQYSMSESDLAGKIDNHIKDSKGRVFVTTISSNIDRWSQAIQASKKYGRKIVPLGYSVKKIIQLAQELAYVDLKKSDVIDPRRVANFPDKNLTFLVAGFAAQANSALSKIVMGKHQVKIKSGDKVIFTAPDYIPGTTSGIYKLIDALSKMGAEVIHSGSSKDTIHVSGHGSEKEHALLVNLTDPKFLLPIGGNYRHVKQYEIMAQRMGFKPGQILTPDPERAVTFWANGKVDFNTRIPHRQVLVDGLGVGDVGHIVLRDRRTLSKNGIVVITMLVGTEKVELLQESYVTTRGFVFEKESKGVLNEIKRTAEKVFQESKSKPINIDFVRQKVQAAVEDQIYRKTKREPMVVPLIIQA